MSKLDEILFEGVATSDEDAKNRIKALMLEIIGEDEKPKPKPESKNRYERYGTCLSCYGKDYCTHEILDDLRDELRKKVAAL